MSKMLLYFVFLILLSNPALAGKKDKDDDKQSKLTILSISQSPSSIVRPVISGLRGGTLIYIKYSGSELNQNNVNVFVGNFPCLIGEDGGVSDSFITCETTDTGSQNDIVGLYVTVVSKGKTYATTTPDYVNFFRYMTPQVNQIFPSAGFSKSTVHFYGPNSISKIGDKKDTGDVKKLLIGKKQCNMIDIAQNNFNSYLKCLAPSQLDAGKYNITQKLRGGFAIKSQRLRRPSLVQGEYFEFAHLPTVSSISQSSGQEGGQRLTITGTGFSNTRANNSVSIDGTPCIITQVNGNQIQCKVPPKNHSASAKLSTNSTNQTNGYFSGAGLSYARYANMYYGLDSFIQSVRSGNPLGSLEEKGFRGELREYTYMNAYIGEFWKGYFTAPVSGLYTFRGLADASFKMFLSKVEGSTQLPAQPFIYSPNNFQRWNNFYFDDIYTAENSVTLNAGKSYYMEVYHSNSYNNLFKIAVDVPNNDTSLPFQAYEVHRLVVDAEVQPEVIIYSMVGAGSSNSTINMKLIRTDKEGNIYYNLNVTIPYACDASTFQWALNNFDSFYPYMISVVRNLYDSSGNLTNTTINATKIDYVVSIFLLRDISLQQENFIITKKYYSGTFTKTIAYQHSPLISGTFSLKIGGLTLNNGSIGYGVSEYDLQTYFRTIKGYEQVEVQSKTVYGCGYSCVWVISYKGVNAAIPNITLSAAKLTGGKSPPTVNMTVRRYYSPSITFEPIDYRFLNTDSNVSNVLVTTNGMPSVCTGNCAYQFRKEATIQYLSMSSSEVYLSISNSSKISISLIKISLNDINCKIKNTSTVANLTCSITPNSDGSLPLTAGPVDLQVLIKAIGILQLDPSVNPLVIPLVASSLNLPSGGMNGGTVNKLFGSGFTRDKTQISIKICNKTATIKSSTFSQIIFYMPSCEVPGNHTVLLTIGTMNSSSISYNYIGPSGPLITSITPASSNPTIKTTMTIVGSGFGMNQSAVQVFLSNSSGKVYQMKIMNFTNTSIVVGLSGGNPGNYTVQVTVDEHGDSQPANSGSDLFTYDFAITSVSPSSGSYFGGTLLTITGVNFSPAYSDTLVYIGSTLNWFCSIESITKTEIKCRTPQMSSAYEVGQSVQVVVSTKLYMLNSCPNNNCKFTYLDSSVSPYLASISSSMVTTQAIALNGLRFYPFVAASNSSNSTNSTNSSAISNSSSVNSSFQVILYLSTNSSLSYVMTPITSNATYVSFYVASTIPTGYYNVRIRNTYGESNSLSLKRQWKIGSPSQTSGSTQGNVVTFTGGYGYPLTLSDSYYATVYNYADGLYYKANVISCCTNNIAVIGVPAVSTDAQLEIRFVTPTNFYSSYLSVTGSNTPKLALISSSVINPGSNTITIQRIDSLSPQISTISLVSAINSLEVITVSNWTTNISSLQHTFTVNLTSGSYKVVAYTSMGYCLFNTTISVSLKNGTTITSKPASYAGDQVTIYGQYLSASSYIDINGFTGTIETYTPNAVTYNVPLIDAAALQASVSTLNANSNLRPEDEKKGKNKRIGKQRLTPFCDQNGTAGNAAYVLDNDKKTYYSSVNSICWIGVDIGANLAVDVRRIRYFANMNWTNVAKKLIGAEFEGSNNMNNWTKLGTVGSSVHKGWNAIKVDQSQPPFRYFRMRHNSISQCNIAEMQLFGKVFTSVTPNLTSFPTTVTYMDGYNAYTFNNALEFRIDRTPIVSDVVPQFGDIFGGYNIVITGSYLNFGTKVVLIDSVPCVIVSSNSSRITCTVGARPNYTGTPSFEVTVNGSSAIINKSFFYVLKWSDARTWGVDLPPINGDLIYVPAGMTLLVDQDTPDLLGIAAQNATIIFPNDRDITVTTGFITMVGGSLIAGRQSDPLMGNLKIVLTGDYYGKQQPTFGNKGIGCLDCRLSLYGKPRLPTWTTIANTISPGDTTFTVSVDVDWQVGESIAIASSSFDHTESEERQITAINNRTITVDTPFAYQHISTVEQYGPSDKLVIRTEVGLLTRNIQILGDSSTPIGNYGPHVMAASTYFNSLQVQIGYVQLFQCGQPQIPGRYCIFFNSAKDMPQSFVRGNSIHQSYAKMIVLYDTNYLVVEDNVGFKNKGHNIFLQSGSQTYNSIRNNLIISTLYSSSMLQTDQSPASFWITHPTNDIYGNHAAGSDYYGLIYYTSEFADEPSDICTFGTPLGLVSDNVIHSNTQYGMRIVKLYARTYPCQAVKDEYNSDDLWLNNPSIASVFNNFIIYKNKQGVWAEKIGHLVFNNFTVADHQISGVELQTANFTGEMVSVSNSIFVGKSQAASNSNSTTYGGMAGVITPRTGQSNLTNVRFYSFPSGTISVATCAKCNDYYYFTNVGTEVFFKQVSFTSVNGLAVSMYGDRRDIIYDLDGSLSTYFFNNTQANGTLMNNFNHITFSSDRCRTSTWNSWSSLVFCGSNAIIRRIMLTNAIGANYWYDLYWEGMYVMPIYNISNTTSIDYSITTSVGMTYPTFQKQNSWSLPFIAGMTYQVWWTNNADFNHLSLTTTPLYSENEPGVVFKFPYTTNRQLYSVGPMRSYIFPTSSQIVPESLDNPHPYNCTNGQYRHVNDAGSRMLAICQSGKNKTKYQYTEVNAVYCKYVCPTPPLPALPSSAGIIIKESFVRFWSNASMWPNGTIPAAGQDVFINGNWTVLLDMDPNPIRYMIVDGALIADDTRDIYITAQSIHIRAGSITAGSSSAPFLHKFTIQVNNTANAEEWTVDEMISGNKFLVVSGSLNLYGTPPATTSTYLTQTALSGDTKIYVASQNGWVAGDSLVLSPSMGKHDEFERVMISSVNPADGSVSLTSPLKFTHYGSYSSLSYNHGNIDVNTKVGHLDRNIKILSGPDTSYGLDFIVYGYWDDKMRWVGSISFNGVQVEGINGIKYMNVLSGQLASSITSSSFANCRSFFANLQNSNQITITSNIFYHSDGFGVVADRVKTFTFSSNLMMGVMDYSTGCFSIGGYIPPTGDISIKDNFCLGSASYGFNLPLIKCSELEENPMGNNTVGSARVGFILNNIHTSDSCKAFSYLKAYGCKIGQIANPASTTKLVFEHFVLADNERGVTLKYADQSNSKQYTGELSYSSIVAVSRPSCQVCYGQNKLSCANNIGVQMLSISSQGSSSWYDASDEITSPEVWLSTAFIKNVDFQNFRASYNLSQCQNNYIFRPHRQAYDAVAMHSLYGCSCANCDNESYLLADPNDPQTGYMTGCGDIPCTGKSNYLVIDWDGTLLGQVATLVPTNTELGAKEGCTFNAHMNAYICYRTDLSVLGYQSTASDYNTRIMWPVDLFYEGSNYTTTTNGWREWEWRNNQPQNRRLGRFISIIKFNTTYNMTFKSMPPASMDFQLERRRNAGTSFNYVVVKIKYPVPNLIRITANSEIVNPILLVDGGIKRPINTSTCGDNIYYYTNYTSNFVITEDNCMITLELVETVQLTTHFAMKPEDFFANTVMSSFIDNLCALLGVTDTSRIKIVGVYTGSTVVKTMILPANLAADNSTNGTSSSNSTNGTTFTASTEPTLAQVQQTLSNAIQTGVYSGSMLNSTGYQVITSTSALYEVPNLSSNDESSLSSISIPMLAGIVVGGIILIIITIGIVIHCLRKNNVNEEFDESDHQEKEIVPSDSIIFSNDVMVEVPEKDDSPPPEQKQKLSKVTNNMRRNKRLARNNNNSGLQVKQVNQEYFDFEE